MDFDKSPGKTLVLVYVVSIAALLLFISLITFLPTGLIPLIPIALLWIAYEVFDFSYQEM
jgi:CHASE2 domain-containing sensor protein